MHAQSQWAGVIRCAGHLRMTEIVRCARSVRRSITLFKERSSIRRSDRWSLLTLPPGAPPGSHAPRPCRAGSRPGTCCARRRVAFDGQRPAGKVTPAGMAEIDGNEIRGSARASPDRRKARIFAHTSTPVRLRTSHMIRNLVRVAGTSENSKRTTMRRSGSASRSARLRKAPHQKARIEIARL